LDGAIRAAEFGDHVGGTAGIAGSLEIADCDHIAGRVRGHAGDKVIHAGGSVSLGPHHGARGARQFAHIAQLDTAPIRALRHIHAAHDQVALGIHRQTSRLARPIGCKLLNLHGLTGGI